MTGALEKEPKPATGISSSHLHRDTYLDRTVRLGCGATVGGVATFSSLSLNAAGAVSSETGWAGSGGGKSHYFSRPLWQRGDSIPQGNQRLVPDVSLTADPSHGALLVLNGSPLAGGIGGTSWSAPVWAAFCALMNQSRTKAGKAALGFLPPLIYPLAGTPCFRDITAGSNGAYHAAKGYDMVTGIGVPDVETLISKLP